MKRLFRAALVGLGLLLSLPAIAGTPANMYYWDGAAWQAWLGTLVGGTSVTGTDADNAANSTTKVPVIPCRANAAAPTWTEGHEAPCSVDLAGGLRITGQGTAGSPSGGVVSVQGVSGGTSLPVTSSVPAAATILDGYQTFTSTTGATTLITVTQGKTWTGTLGANVSCQEAPTGAVACDARAVFTTTGAGTTPAAGTWLACEAKSGANTAATGLTGSEGNNACSSQDLIVNCASGTCTVAVASTNAGTASVVDAWAHGTQQ